MRKLLLATLALAACGSKSESTFLVKRPTAAQQQQASAPPMPQ